MCDDVENNQTDSRLSLLDLPVEIFLHVCSFLDASTLVHSLGLVCKQFHEILNADSLWKVRIKQILPDAGYPILPPAEDEEYFWKLSCVALERQATLWRKKDSMEVLLQSQAHCSTIDSLLLMHNGDICISGARDRSLVCWKLPTTEDKKQSITRKTFAHNGWIWDLAAIDNRIYSCSWDNTVNVWTLTDTDLVPLRTNKLNSGAVLCLATCPELIVFAAGSFCKTVFLFDSRLCDPILMYHPHERAVIALAMNSDFILSASEDKTVAIWDQRAGKVMKNVTISQESFPMSMCMQRDIVYVGDGNAKLHILDPKKDFERVKCYSTQHQKGINGVHVAPGCLITSSRDMTVRICSPTDPPQHFVALTSCYGEIASTDYSNDVLAASGSEGIQIWRPKSRVRGA